MNKKKGPLLPTLLLLQGRLHKERQGMRGNRTKDPLSIGTFQKVFPIGILSLPLRNDSIPCVKPSLSLRLPPIYGPPHFDFDALHYSDIERSDLNDPPSPSNEGLLPSHPHTPSIISQQSIHPPSTPGLDAARASQIHVMGCLEHHGLMQLDLPVSPLSGADPDDPDDHGNDDPPSQPSPSPPHTPPPVQNPDPSQPSPSPPHIPPPVQNVQHGRPPAPWQKKATFDDCAFLQPYGAASDNFYQQLNLGHMSYKCNHCGALHWLEERIAKSSKANLKFGRCCNNGKVLLPLL